MVDFKKFQTYPAFSMDELNDKSEIDGKELPEENKIISDIKTKIKEGNFYLANKLLLEAKNVNLAQEDLKKLHELEHNQKIDLHAKIVISVAYALFFAIAFLTLFH